MSRFLLVRMGALGDIVHAIPVAAALRTAFPSARIDWLVAAKHREVLDLVPVVDRRIVIDGGSRSGGRSSLLGILQQLRRERYDIAIDLQGLIKSAVIARASRAQRVIGFSSKYVREALASRLYTEVHDPGGDGMYAESEKRHVVDINLGLLASLGISAVRPAFPIESPHSTSAAALIERTQGSFALLNPGAAWPNKRWPARRFGELAARLFERHRLRSVILWGPEEGDLAAEVVALAGEAAIRAPQTAIADVIALARAAAIMVSGDTGPTHLAAAVGTPIVGLYGPTRPERNGPWADGDETVSRAAACRCHHLRQCRQAQMCLEDIPVDEVLGAVERRLAAIERSRV